MQRPERALVSFSHFTSLERHVHLNTCVAATPPPAVVSISPALRAKRQQQQQARRSRQSLAACTRCASPTKRPLVTRPSSSFLTAGHLWCINSVYGATLGWLRLQLSGSIFLICASSSFCREPKPRLKQTGLRRTHF